MKPIVGITNATGMIYATRLLETFYALGAETCLIMSREAGTALERETDYSLPRLQGLVRYFCYDDAPALPIREYDAAAMILVPCSLAAIAPLVQDLPLSTLQKTAGAILKLKKKLIMVTSEPVLAPEHLKILLAMAYKGATIMPYMPSFYHKPASIDDIVTHHTGRVLDLLAIDHNLLKRWGEDIL
ncbi:UbiX family flavin prenyltransferase [Sporomusa termitida]|uniref:Putative UbiX-like flavin prenyltransferase n=1 Tax=Sporomusa termitida TaxID=2377 RepID=A0A517DXT0_9FIRM|nr:UbiX family flavin prenyltransferase [Sporomusa termitida]QDR82148.1 putative UbiX-like flavin prenyltransferase [Sporomusa termitida]